MNKKMGWLFTVIIIISMFTSGCGTKSAQDLVGDLNKQTEKMSGYKLNAKLTLQTGKDPLSYDVEVWHHSPNLYRVVLTSQAKDVSQIILRNQDGVFVLTPHLKKSFSFQSGWPENHAQVYLYDSLVRSILEDEQRQFAQEDEHYVLHVKADYQNQSLTSQKIVLNSDLEPIKTEVMDANQQVLVTVDFSDFEKNPKFDDDSFTKERNLETSKLQSNIPTMSQQSVPNKEPKGSFGVIQPSYTPNGVNFLGVEKVDREEGPQLVLRYKGEFNYTLIEERPRAATVSFPSGEIVDLNGTMAVIVGDEHKTMTWTDDGVEFLLAGDLSEDEMIAVAKSTMNQSGK